MITKKARRLADIEQEIKTLTTAAITGDITHVTARYEIQKLSNERECIWADERERLWEVTKTAKRLCEIERELGITWLEFHVGVIPRSVANTKMQELEDEKERLL